MVSEKSYLVAAVKSTCFGSVRTDRVDVEKERCHGKRRLDE